MTTPSVLFDVHDGVATLTLNAAERMNPLTPELQRGCLDAGQRRRDHPPIRALLVPGRAGGCCVGAARADLGSRADRPGSGALGAYVGKMMEETGNPLVAGLRSLPVPVVCAVNGAAAGGGVGLALAGDRVIAARSAYF